MAQSSLLFTKSDRLARSQAQSLRFRWSITGASTVTPETTLYFPILTGFTTSLSQSAVNAFFTATTPGKTTSIVAATSFGTTAMGTDAMGFVIDCEGGVSQVLSVRASCWQTAGGTPANTETYVLGTQGVAALPNTLVAAVGVSAEGDIYGHVVCTNLTAATAGFLDLEVFFRSK